MPQSSVAQLREHGHFDRYCKHIDAKVLQEISTNLAPGCVGLELAEAHYRACDALDLSTEELDRIRQTAGQRIRESALVVSGKNAGMAIDVWAGASQPHRVWKRLYQGGSVQFAKIAPTERPHRLPRVVLNKFRYFRCANLAGIKGVHEAIGIRVESARIVRYEPTTLELTVHLVWM